MGNNFINDLAFIAMVYKLVEVPQFFGLQVESFDVVSLGASAIISARASAIISTSASARAGSRASMLTQMHRRHNCKRPH